MKDSDLNADDEGVIAALRDTLGHPGPFGDAECSSLTLLRVKHVSTLGFVGRFPNLSELECVACSFRSLEPLASLRNLRCLRIVATPVTSLEPLKLVPGLETVTIIFGQVEDLKPLLTMSSLREARLIGNPLSDESWDDVRRMLWSASDPRAHAMKLEFCGPVERDLTVSVAKRGWGLAFAAIDGFRPYFVRLGFRPQQHGEVDFVKVTGDYGASYGEDKDDEEDAFRSLIETFGQGDELDISSGRILGTAAEAMEWVTSSQLPEDEKAALLRFISRFPTLTFFRESAQLLDAIAGHPAWNIRLPEPLKQVRQVLAGVAPGSFVCARFDAFDDPSPRTDRLATAWYSFGIPRVNNDDERELLVDYCNVYAIGHWEWMSTLAVGISDIDDPTVYEFFEQDLLDYKKDGYTPREGVNPAFESYASMLGHIVAIQIDLSIVCEAQEQA